MIARYTDKTFEKKPEKRNLGIINFDADNLYPYWTEQLVQNSGILSTCVSIYAKFITGGGLATDIWKRKIGKFTVDKFFRKLQADYAKHKMFAFWVGRNGLLEINNVVPLPIEYLRLRFPDEEGNINKIMYSENWHKSKAKMEIREYDIYTSDIEITARQIANAGGVEKWNGQIYFYGSDGSLEYSTNSFHEVIEDVVTDIQCKKGMNAESMTGFMNPTIIEVPFYFSDIEKQQGLRENELKEQFHNELSQLQGYDNLGKYMTVENNAKDIDQKKVPITFTQIKRDGAEEKIIKTQSAVQQAIRRKFVIPEIFIDAVSTGFSTEIMTDMYNFYNQMTALERQVFEELANEILPAFFGENDYSIIPLKYI
jgi:hypothetical protein